MFGMIHVVTRNIWDCSRHGPLVSVLLNKAAARAVGMARSLGSGHCPERSAWLGHSDRVLLTPARCADVPPLARASGQPGRGERARRPQKAPLAGSDDAEARRAAGRRCGGFAQSRGRRRSFDTVRSDPCARHQQGSCGRRFVRQVRLSQAASRLAHPPSTKKGELRIFGRGRGLRSILDRK